MSAESGSIFGETCNSPDANHRFLNRFNTPLQFCATAPSILPSQARFTKPFGAPYMMSTSILMRPCFVIIKITQPFS